jgi:ribosomal protein S18 acetylase RimI-like enzyme
VLIEYNDEIPVAALRAIESNQGKWFIEAVEVNPDYRHRGYGKMLLQDTLSFLKNKKASIVECIILKENELSKRLHLSCGFLSTTDEPINCWDELEEDSVLYRLVM